MSIYEVGENPTFEELRKFATNILGEAKNTGSQFKDIDTRLVYWQTQSQVLVAQKLDAALTRLSDNIVAASNDSSTAAAAALDHSKKMVVATWALVGGTVALAIATGGLVWYTRLLAAVETANP